MSRKELASKYCHRINNLLSKCLDSENLCHKDEIEKLHQHNQTRIERLLRNYEQKARTLQHGR